MSISACPPSIESAVALIKITQLPPPAKCQSVQLHDQLCCSYFRSIVPLLERKLRCTLTYHSTIRKVFRDFYLSYQFCSILLYTHAQAMCRIKKNFLKCYVMSLLLDMVCFCNTNIAIIVSSLLKDNATMVLSMAAII